MGAKWFVVALVDDAACLAPWQGRGRGCRFFIIFFFFFFFLPEADAHAERDDE